MSDNIGDEFKAIVSQVVEGIQSVVEGASTERDVVREPDIEPVPIEKMYQESLHMEREYAYVAGSRDAWREMALRQAGVFQEDDGYVEVADDDE